MLSKRLRSSQNEELDIRIFVHDALRVIHRLKLINEQHLRTQVTRFPGLVDPVHDPDDSLAEDAYAACGPHGLQSGETVPLPAAASAASAVAEVIKVLQVAKNHFEQAVAGIVSIILRLTSSEQWVFF